MLPIVFVSLGLGSVIVSAVEFAPWLATVSHHKSAVFIGVGALLAVNYRLAIERPRRMNCPPGESCNVESPAMRTNRVVFWVSVAIYAGAVTFTYAALFWARAQS
jgi:hypothetical protein